MEEERSLPVPHRIDPARLKGDLVLLLVSFVWGSGFVAQRLATEHLGVFVFNGVRFLLAGLFLLPFVGWKLRFERRAAPWMLAAGVMLFSAVGFQQAGIFSTSIANAGFITGLYVVIIPIIQWIAWRQHVTWVGWVSAALAAVGISLLSTGGLPGLGGSPLTLASGDALELAGAFFWALHVIVVGKAARRINPAQFAMGQFFVVSLLSLAAGLFFEARTFAGLALSWPVVFYSAAIPICLGFTLQAVGQKQAPALDSALILSLETVFAALFGLLLLGEGFGPAQIAGALIILVAILLAQAFNRNAVEA